MGNEAASLPVREHTTTMHAYEVVETVQAIAAMIQLVTATRAEQVALVTITLHFELEGRAYPGRLAQTGRSAHYFLDNLRPLVRKTDVVALLDHTFYFILLGANREGGGIVQSRLWDALLWRVHNTNDGETPPCSMAIGHSAYPNPSRTIDQCIAAASEVHLSFDAQSETSVRKIVHRAKPSQQQGKDGELPALARKLGIPYLSLLPRKLPEQVQQLVNLRLAQELHCYPLGRERGILTVAMSNPQDNTVLDRLRQETGMHIFPVLAHPRELQTALDQLV